MRSSAPICRALTFGAALLASAGAALAQKAPPRPAGIDFPSGSFSFPVSAFPFPSGEISFPSRLEQTETPNTVEVLLPADVLFDFDKSDLRPAAEETLRELAALIRDRARGPVRIDGHTDSMGSDAYNQRLSDRRAAAVKAWLAAKGQIPASRLQTAGFGARQPVAQNRKPDGSDNPEGRQLNRRVAVVIRK